MKVDVSMVVLTQVEIPDDAVLMARATGELEKLRAFVAHHSITAIRLEPQDVKVELVEANAIDVNLEAAR